MTKDLQIINPKTGEVIRNYEKLLPEQKSDLLTDINFYQRSMKKIEDFIKLDIKNLTKEQLGGETRELLFGHHKVSLVSRPYFDKSKMTDEERGLLAGLEKKYSVIKFYLIIK